MGAKNIQQGTELAKYGRSSNSFLLLHFNLNSVICLLFSPIHLSPPIVPFLVGKSHPYLSNKSIKELSLYHRLSIINLLQAR